MEKQFNASFIAMEINRNQKLKKLLEEKNVVSEKYLCDVLEKSLRFEETYELNKNLEKSMLVLMDCMEIIEKKFLNFQDFTNTFLSNNRVGQYQNFFNEFDVVVDIDEHRKNALLNKYNSEMLENLGEVDLLTTQRKEIRISKDINNYLKKNGLNNSEAINLLLFNAIRKREGSHVLVNTQVAVGDVKRRLLDLTKAIILHQETLYDIFADE